MFAIYNGHGKCWYINIFEWRHSSETEIWDSTLMTSSWRNGIDFHREHVLDHHFRPALPKDHILREKILGLLDPHELKSLCHLNNASYYSRRYHQVPKWDPDSRYFAPAKYGYYLHRSNTPSDRHELLYAEDLYLPDGTLDIKPFEKYDIRRKLCISTGSRGPHYRKEKDYYKPRALIRPETGAGSNFWACDKEFITRDNETIPHARTISIPDPNTPGFIQLERQFGCPFGQTGYQEFFSCRKRNRKTLAGVRWAFTSLKLRFAFD